MKTIIEILKACNDNIQLLACLICLIFVYVFVASAFWAICWQCGVMSIFMTYCICEASCYLKDWMEKSGDDNE